MRTTALRNALAAFFFTAALASPAPAQILVEIVESGGATEVSEAGARDSYSIVLTVEPTASVTVAISVPAAQLSTTQTQVVFTSSNWDQPTTITVSAVDDPLNEGLHFATISHTASSADLDFNGTTIAPVEVSIADNDLPGITVTESGDKTEAAEGGAGDSYQIVLDTQPSANVTVTLTVPASQLRTDKPSVLFTPANWNQPQAIAVTAFDDPLDEGLHFANITHAATSADSNYNGAAVEDVTVSITDNDSPEVLILESNGKTEVAEGGAGDSYQVVLGALPAASVTVTLTVPVAQVQTDKTVLTFTTANWNQAQTVTVTAVNDLINEDLHFATITHAVASADANYNGLAAAGVDVSIADNDGPEVIVTESAGQTQVVEGGAGDSYSMVLGSQPSSSVTIALTFAPGQFTTDKSSLIFTSSNWNQAQAVTVTAVDDGNDEGAHFGAIVHDAASADPNYNSIAVAAVAVAIVDNDSVSDRIIDYLLGRTAVSAGLDVNGDSKVDIADYFFSKPPNEPASPSPAHQATSVSITADMDWADSLGAATYDVFLWRSDAPPPPVPSLAGSAVSIFNPSADLEYFTNYSWQVVAIKGAQRIAGPVWTFRTRLNPGGTPIDQIK